MNELEMLIQQTEYNVGEAMLSCLDKADMMLEYVGYSNDALDEYVSEMFELFMEATARRKKADEIDAYMKKHNWGDVNAKTPAQAKKARQIRNFLIMQDFDPKTETIKSSDGKRRIKFNFNDISSFFAHHIDPDNQSLNEIRINGRHNPGKINKNLIFSVNHEKGHEQFRADSRSKRWSGKDTPEDKSERGIQHIDAAKAAGKKISSHDDGTYITHSKQSPEELEADLHGIKNARVRTKYAGRKRAVKRSGATRDLTDKEITGIFTDMQKRIEFNSFFASTLDDKLYDISEIEEQEKAIGALKLFKNNIYKYNKNMNDIKFKKTDGDSYEVTIDPDMKQMYELLQEISYQLPLSDNINESVFNNYNACLRDIEKELRRIEMAKLDFERLSDYNEDEYHRDLIKYENKMKEYQSELNKIISKYPNIENDIGMVKEIFIDKLDSLYSLIEMKNRRWNRTFQISSYDFITITNRINSIKKDLNSGKYKTIIDEYIKGFESIKNLVKSNYEFKKRLQKWHQIKGGNVKPDDSTQMRHDFVKKYVHECFEEFMMDYYSFENVFGDYMED